MNNSVNTGIIISGGDFNCHMEGVDVFDKRLNLLNEILTQMKLTALWRKKYSNINR